MNAPLYIDADTYTGKHTVRGPGKRYRVTTWAAGEIAALAPEGVLFTSFGHVNGVECFGRNRYVAGPGGELHLYDSEGAVKILHPADRKLRILTV